MPEGMEGASTEAGKESADKFGLSAEQIAENLADGMRAERFSTNPEIAGNIANMILETKRGNIDQAKELASGLQGEELADIDPITAGAVKELIGKLLESPEA